MGSEWRRTLLVGSKWGTAFRSLSNALANLRIPWNPNPLLLPVPNPIALRDRPAISPGASGLSVSAFSGLSGTLRSSGPDPHPNSGRAVTGRNVRKRRRAEEGDRRGAVPAAKLPQARNGDFGGIC